MKIWLAGGITCLIGFNNDFGIKNYLFSYADLMTHSAQKRWLDFFIDNKERRRKMVYFLDSGAFSAYHSGVKVPLSGFIDFVMKYKKHFEIIAGLDVMHNPEASMRNYMDQRRMGLDVIPTYHYPEPWEYLEKYCEMSNYVAIGGTGALRPTLLQEVIKKIISMVPKRVKIHLFGMTTPKMMFNFGSMIESVDSSSWLYGRYRYMLTRSGKYMNLKHKGIMNKDLPLILEYNVSRFKEIEQDINNSFKVNKIELVQGKGSARSKKG